MIFRNLDENGDWLMGKGINDYVRDNAAIALNIKTRVLSWLNDCFFDMTAGIDWLNRMGLKNQEDLLRAELKNMVLKSAGVTGINAMDIALSGRSFTANFSVNTIFSSDFQNNIEVSL